LRKENEKGNSRRFIPDANLNDKWFAVCLGQDEKTVLARLGNNIEVPK